MNSDGPVYVSKRCWRSLWNEYRVYNDRIELGSWLYFRTFVIPLDELVSIDTFRSPVLRTTRWALKFDWCDLVQHVGIERKQGWFKRLRFTPHDLHGFIAAVRKARH